MSNAIAIVGSACCYPDARSPNELWENVLAQRKAFRRIPPERLRLEDYWSADRSASDCIYSTEAAVIKDYEFDRLRFRISGNTFRSADQAHWLALDVAAQALGDAGFTDGEGLQRESTGVFLGNTLTGEFSRANNLRLRWPYVRRVIDAALAGEEWSPEQRQIFSQKLEVAYKQPFPAIGEESLAGGLSNTIAGRICNYFNFQGGGYTVDGACASSLLALANACSALVAGDVDAALAGGVDLSLDPFELVGFAKTGALATEMMRIYDKRSNGFWPGEGCGFVVLMRHDDALAQRRRVYALIKGWGISSDGSGGITRPEVEGQLLALRRAYRRAGFGIDSVAYFEGHGTGTAVGDTVELQALSRARQETGRDGFPAAIGSVKANIGHTKAAAGVAGVIKAVLALQAGIIPPTTGGEDPHPELLGSSTLRTPRVGELWPDDQPRRAGVSSMGFGGINAHVVLEASESCAHFPKNGETSRSSVQSLLPSSAQDAELFLFGGQTAHELQQKLDQFASFTAKLSYAELSDLSAQLGSDLGDYRMRAAIVASSPSGLTSRLGLLKSVVQSNKTRIDVKSGVFFSAGNPKSGVGFLFPGQGSPANVSGGALRRRFTIVDQIYANARLDQTQNEVATEIAQPAIVTASIAAMRLLNSLGVSAELAIGHSLGELSALCWAGALDEDSLLRIARARGRAMMQSNGIRGGMASITAGAADVRSLLSSNGVCIAGLNSSLQTVISGEIGAVDEVIERARLRNIGAVKLPVSHAFHSPLVATAAPSIAAHVAAERFNLLERKVISTITGQPLRSDANLPLLLDQQITSPVRFLEAVTTDEAREINLWIETGPGQVLGGIMTDITSVPVISIDSGSETLRGLLCAVGAAFVLGQSVNHQALFEGRFTRDFTLDWRPKFFSNPCELAPINGSDTPRIAATKIVDKRDANLGENCRTDSSPLELLTQLIVRRTELPASSVNPQSRFLSDLHLNSITVSQIVGEAARFMHLPRPVSANDFADATIAETAGALEEQVRLGPTAWGAEIDSFPAGVDSWVRPFCVELVERTLEKHAGNSSQVRNERELANKPGNWRVLAPLGHPFGDLLRQRFLKEAGGGVVVCLPHDPDECVIDQLLAGARMALREKEPSKFVLVQNGKGAASFARTLHLEAPQVTTCVISVSYSHPRAPDWVIDEALAADGYIEVHYDPEGRRHEPVARPMAMAVESDDLLLSPADVLLVSGGGKGITAECALALAKETGSRLALIGRSDPEKDLELSENLKRFVAAGVEFRYLSADITNAGEVRAAVERVQHQLGPITGILHGAARNEPQLLTHLDEASFRQTVGVKVQGARNLLAAINSEKLKLLISFSSIIARTGLAGESDYGLANEWLSQLTEEWKTQHPLCRCLSVEWSIWSGKGMGGRLGDSDRLMQQGISPISPDAGISMLRRLLGQPNAPVSVVVMSRFSDLPTFKIDRPELPFLRFLEQPRVYYPNIELVVDADLSTVTDPYLDDHIFQGDRILPAVIGLEAMAQAASALVGSSQAILFENISFNKPVIVPETGSLKIRLAALARDDTTVEVSLRSEETGFHMNHFQATCRFKDKDAVVELQSSPSIEFSDQLSLDPEKDLYGSLMFQSGRFRRIRNYRLLTAKECIAEIVPDGTASWFSQYLPGKLISGDPGARDATLHAIQACIPHKTILPIAVERLMIMGASRPGPLFVHARERSHEGDLFVYDVAVSDSDGRLCEQWDGLELKAVSQRSVDGPWIEALLGPYIDRRVEELIPGSDISVALLRDDRAGRRERSDRAIQTALGKDVQVFRRPDGKPDVHGDRFISASHARELSFAVGARKPVSCDLEHVVTRSNDEWIALLGAPGFELAKFLSKSANEDLLAAATRIWTAGECLKKLGADTNTPLTFVSVNDECWVVLSAGCRSVATYSAVVDGQTAKLILTLAT